MKKCPRCGFPNGLINCPECSKKFNEYAQKFSEAIGGEIYTGRGEIDFKDKMARAWEGPSNSGTAHITQQL